MKNIRENNILIAEFLGARYYAPSQEYELYGILEFIDDGENEQHHFTPNQMRFSKSWDWLMPVVEKIEQTDVNGDFAIIIIQQATCEIEMFEYARSQGRDSTFFEGDNKLDATYKAVVEFIKWYNTK